MPGRYSLRDGRPLSVLTQPQSLYTLGARNRPQPPLVYGSARARGYNADRLLEALSHRGLPGGRLGVRRKTPARTFQGPLNPPARGRYGILLSRSATRLSRRDVVERERIVMVEPRRTGMSMSSSGSHATPCWREMDSNFRYRGTKAVNFRSIPGAGSS